MREFFRVVSLLRLLLLLRTIASFELLAVKVASGDIRHGGPNCVEYGRDRPRPLAQASAGPSAPPVECSPRGLVCASSGASLSCGHATDPLVISVRPQVARCDYQHQHQLKVQLRVQLQRAASSLCTPFPVGLTQAPERWTRRAPPTRGRRAGLRRPLLSLLSRPLACCCCCVISLPRQTNSSIHLFDCLEFCSLAN